jgi:DNA-directed RNA polymerase subunit RPC12/RpoP
VGTETLGQAWNLGWQIRIRCLDGGREGLKHRRDCGYRTELDLQTLVCTRGRDFPLARIAERLRCPRCGCRRVAVMFDPPANRGVSAAAVPARAYHWRAHDGSDD